MFLVLLAVFGWGENPSKVLDEAGQLMARGEAEGAAGILRSWLEGPDAGRGTPGEGAVWGALGKASRMFGDFETVASAFQQAFEIDGQLESALLAAECFLEMRNPHGAELALKKCDGHRDPNLRASIDELRGMALFMRGKEDEAYSHLKRAREGGRRGSSHFLGIIHFHRAEYEKALKYLEEAIRADPGDYYSLLYRGWTFLELHRIDDARRALLETQKVAATAEVENMLGLTELRAERFQEALRHFHAALAGNPLYAEAQNGAASALRRLGCKEEARAASKAFRKLFHDQQEHLRIAFELDQKMLAHPSDPKIAEELGRHYFSNFDLLEAERLAWKALSLDPGRISARILLARTFTRSGRYRFAAFQYQKILRMRPDHAEARAELEELIRKYAKSRVDGQNGGSGGIENSR